MLSNRLQALVVSLLALPAAAQAPCGSFSGEFAGPGYSVTGAAVVDFGSGPSLYVSDLPLVSPPFTVGGRVQRWTGDAWDPSLLVLPVGGLSRSVTQLIAGDDGSGPALFAVETQALPAASVIWRFDGLAWAQIGSLNGYSELKLLDDGGGAAWIAFGSFSTIDGLAVPRVGRWNGTSWSGYAGGPPAVPGDVTSFDPGSGPRLHVGMQTSASVAVWNGSSWAPLGPALGGSVYELEVFDPGSGPTLYAGTVLHGGTTANGLYRWNGSAWTLVPGLDEDVEVLTVADLGAGPRLLVAGDLALGGAPVLPRVASYDGTTITALGGTMDRPPGALTTWASPSGLQLLATRFTTLTEGRGTNGMALWNGSSWSGLGQGLNAPVRALAVHDSGAGDELVVGGEFTRPENSLPCASVARWNGAGCAPLAGGLPEGVQSLASVAVAGTPTLFAGGDFWSQGATFYGGMAQWNGTSWAPVANGVFGEARALAGFDDGSGLRLCAGGSFTLGGGGPGNSIAAWNGSAWAPLGTGLDASVSALAIFDEGAGATLFAGGAFTTAGGASAPRLARWNGSAWSDVGGGFANGEVLALCSFDDGAGEQLYAGGTFTDAGGVPVSYLARWNGSAWSDLPGGGANGVVFALHVHDDGRGPALYVGGGFSTAGGITAYNVARFDGATWEAVDGGLDGPVRAIGSFDDDGDGDQELFLGGEFTHTATRASVRLARLEGCPHHTSFCSGDGALTDHTTPCPCANDGAPGHGCANPFDASGGLLQASGGTNPDTLELAGSNMPLSAFGIYLQHAALDDRVFHDGVICAGGNLIRLRNRSAVGGSSTYPNSTDTQTVSQRGLVTPGSGATRYYSLFYRSASPTYCPPATANVTNGIRVIW